MAPQNELSRIPEPAAETEVMREQLEYLIEHRAQADGCACSDCQRYLRVRAILLEIFGEPQKAKVLEIAAPFAKAA
jgi:hypothetical protein